MASTTKERRAPTDRLPKKDARRRSVPICFSEEASERLTAAEVGLVVASEADKASAQAELDAARREVKAATWWYHFRSCGQVRYDDLISDNPPTEQQMERYREQVDAERARPVGERETVVPPAFNIRTFAPALIAACLVEVSQDERPSPDALRPAYTAEEISEMTSGPEWNVAEVQSLFDGALATITTAGRTPGKGWS